MSDDAVVKLGAVVVAVSVLYSIARDDAGTGGTSESLPGSALAVLAVVVVLGFVGRRAFEAWRKGSPSTRQPWVRRRAALPPPPDAQGGASEG